VLVHETSRYARWTFTCYNVAEWYRVALGNTMVTFKPSTPNAINPAGRVFVLRVAVVCYMLSLAMYLAGFPGHLFAVWIFGTIGCVFLALYLFASNALCLFIRYKLTGRW
jgi:hypothetical protein